MKTNVPSIAPMTFWELSYVIEFLFHCSNFILCSWELNVIVSISANSPSDSSNNSTNSRSVHTKTVSYSTLVRSRCIIPQCTKYLVNCWNSMIPLGVWFKVISNHVV